MRSNYIQIVFLLVFLCLKNGKAETCGEINPAVYLESLSEHEEILLKDISLTSSLRIGDIFSKWKSSEKSTRKAEDLIRYVPQRIRAEGYPAEVHNITTDDGYILQLFRIPFGTPKRNITRPPVLIMHGLMDSSNCWIALGPDNSLAYLLSNVGYDVWLGNARGTEPSRRHVRLPTEGKNEKEYWSFSWHEIGIYDLPAMIDHILAKTKYEKLNYIGYSQGTTAFFVMASERPEYNDKIIEAQLMGPVAGMTKSNHALYNVLKYFYTPMRKMFDFFKIFKVTVDNKIVLRIAEYTCEKATVSTPMDCRVLLSIIGSNQINCTSLPSILVNTPSGAALRQMIHYFQLFRSGGFHQFDYDDKKINLEKYGSDTPPPYNLTKITVPINLYFSKNDETAMYDDVLLLQPKLRSLKSSYIVPVDEFRHVDFTYSRYVRKAVNDKLLQNVNKINGK